MWEEDMGDLFDDEFLEELWELLSNDKEILTKLGIFQKGS
jgi:hypothetical protein